ncbi:50S ribosomal protein L29 [Candidatus Dojkabacteria bacterium]|nr:50S ribosomal protein L29 [Candidatus Dojkabacteria bacterium]
MHRNCPLFVNLYQKIKKVDIDKLRKKTEEELKTRLTEKRGELVELRYNVKLGKETSYSQVKELKKEIARINTILNEQSFKK